MLRVRTLSAIAVLMCCIGLLTACGSDDSGGAAPTTPTTVDPVVRGWVEPIRANIEGLISGVKALETVKTAADIQAVRERISEEARIIREKLAAAGAPPKALEFAGPAFIQATQALENVVRAYTTCTAKCTDERAAVGPAVQAWNDAVADVYAAH